jgi:hypothetical protein
MGYYRSSSLKRRTEGGEGEGAKGQDVDAIVTKESRGRQGIKDRISTNDRNSASFEWCNLCRIMN